MRLIEYTRRSTPHRGCWERSTISHASCTLSNRPIYLSKPLYKRQRQNECQRESDTVKNPSLPWAQFSADRTIDFASGPSRELLTTGALRPLTVYPMRFQAIWSDSMRFHSIVRSMEADRSWEYLIVNRATHLLSNRIMSPTSSDSIVCWPKWS